MNYLLDPKLFSYIIMALYVLNTLRWAIHGDYGQVLYWFGATILTYAIIFMIGK